MPVKLVSKDEASWASEVEKHEGFTILKVNSVFPAASVNVIDSKIVRLELVLEKSSQSLTS